MTFPHASQTEEVRAVGYYLHLEPGGSALYGGTWRPDRRSLAKIRDAIAWKADDWKQAKRGWTLEGDSLRRAPRGYAENHPLIGDLKRQDFVVSVPFSNAQVCGARFLLDVAGAAKKMAPLLKFLARAQGLEFRKAVVGFGRRSLVVGLWSLAALAWVHAPAPNLSSGSANNAK